MLDFEEEILARVPRRKHQEVAIVSLDPFCRQPPKFAAKRNDIPMTNFFGQTKKLESQNQVVGPQDRFHVGGIGPQAAGRNLGHGIRAFELSQQKLLKPPVAVKTPNRRGRQLQVRYQSSMISVLFEGEQSLLDLFGFQSDGPAHGHKPVFFSPLKRRVGELSGFPAASKLLVSSFYHTVFQRSVHSSHNAIAEPPCIERLDDVFVVVLWIGQDKCLCLPFSGIDCSATTIFSSAPASALSRHDFADGAARHNAVCSMMVNGST